MSIWTACYVSVLRSSENEQTRRSTNGTKIVLRYVFKKLPIVAALVIEEPASGTSALHTSTKLVSTAHLSWGSPTNAMYRSAYFSSLVSCGQYVRPFLRLNQHEQGCGREHTARHRNGSVDDNLKSGVDVSTVIRRVCEFLLQQARFAKPTKRPSSRLSTHDGRNHAHACAQRRQVSVRQSRHSPQPTKKWISYTVTVIIIFTHRPNRLVVNTGCASCGRPSETKS